MTWKERQNKQQNSIKEVFNSAITTFLILTLIFLFI